MNILVALYKEDCFRVRINGLYSGKVHPNKGLKQGCPLSPVLFGLYLADLGTLLKHSKEGVLIHGQTISGLLFADDLVLIARTRDGVKRLSGYCQTYFEQHGMNINCSKSNVLDLGDIDQPPLHLWSTEGEDLGCLAKPFKYKYNYDI